MVGISICVMFEIPWSTSIGKFMYVYVCMYVYSIQGALDGGTHSIRIYIYIEDTYHLLLLL